MPQVVMALSGIKPEMDLVRSLVPTIGRAFEPFGLSLAFHPQDNVILASDPEGPPNKWAPLVQGLRQQSSFTTPAHLVVTLFPPQFDRTIDGQLCDTQTRGVAAVYTEVDLYGAAGAASRPDLMSQVCIHEIGHMFDLTHGLAAQSSYGSSMSPATIRQHWSLPQAWQAASTEAAANGDPPPDPPNPLRYFPFNSSCRHSLGQSAANPSKRPFGGPFSGGSGSAAGDSNRALDLSLEPFEGRATTSVFGSLFVTLDLRNPGAKPVDLPLHIGPEHGTLRVTVTDPDGNLSIYRPHKFICSTARTTLAPGARAYISLAAVPRDSPPLFRMPGPHLCRVEIVDVEHIPKVRLAAAEIEINVVADVSLEAANVVLSRVLAGKRVRKAALDLSAAGDSAVRAHIRLLAARRTRRRSKRCEYLGACMAEGAPRALRHKAARQFALERIALGEPVERVADELSSIFNAPADAQLFDAISRSAHGFALARLRKEVS